MTFCISAQYFHPSWPSDIDYYAIILPNQKVHLIITDHYEAIFMSRDIEIYELNMDDYNRLTQIPNDEVELSNDILRIAFEKHYLENILNYSINNDGYHILLGLYYFAEHDIRHLVDYLAKENPHILNCLDGNEGQSTRQCLDFAVI